MSKKIKLLTIFLMSLFIIIAGIIIFLKNNSKSIVIIKNGKITSENLIDDFINEASQGNESKLIIVIKEPKNKTNIEVEFISKKNEESIDQEDIQSWIKRNVPDSEEDYQRIYGYYKLSINGEEKERYNGFRWNIKRNTIDGIVKLILFNNTKNHQNVNICEYNLDNSNYEQKIKINYKHNKNSEIKTIINKNISNQYDCNIYTFGGDVIITMLNGSEYSLEDAVNENILSSKDILNQAELDEKYGMCEYRYYLDGGSVEYLYPTHTILKDRKGDLYIGMNGEILSIINSIEK